MNTDAVFSRSSDEWTTPPDLFMALHAEFNFDIDVAATEENCVVPGYLVDSLEKDWETRGRRIWCNPPYSKIRPFLERASSAARGGSLVVCLVPSRTDTRWWHDYVWDTDRQRPRDGVEVRFFKGRLKFGDGRGSAPFPSSLLIFRPTPASECTWVGFGRSFLRVACVTCGAVRYKKPVPIP